MRTREPIRFHPISHNGRPPHGSGDRLRPIYRHSRRFRSNSHGSGVRTQPSRPLLRRRQIRGCFRIELKQKFFRVMQVRGHGFAVTGKLKAKVLGHLRFAIVEVVHRVNRRSKELARLVLPDVHLDDILLPSNRPGVPAYSCFCSFAQVSRNSTVRLNTSRSAVEDRSVQKYPRRSN